MDRQQPPPSAEGLLRRLVIVALLAVGAWTVEQLLPDTLGTRPSAGLTALGFALLAAFVLGQLAVKLRLPSLSGYILAGLLLGAPLRSLIPPSWLVEPFSWNVLSGPAIDLLNPIEQVAIGLIALTVGGLVRLDVVRGLARTMGGVLFGQVLTVLAVVAIWISVVGLGLPYVTMPGFEDLGLATALGLGAIIATLCLSGSPAATLAVLHTAGSKGPVSRLVLNVVVFKELIVAVLFALAAPFIALEGNAQSTDLNLPAYVLVHVGAAVLLGLFVGLVMAFYLRRVRREVPLFVVGTVILTTFVADRLALPPVAVLLPAGIVAVNALVEGEKLVREVAKLSTPLYLVFFTLFGARLRIDYVVQFAPFVTPLVLLRLVALRIGAAAGARASGADATSVRFCWAGFVPQNGIALPLTALIAANAGPVGPSIVALMLASVGINELIGPIFFRFSLGRAGELPDRVVRGEGATEEEAQNAATAVQTGFDDGPKPLSRKSVRPWPETARVEDPWGKPAALSSRQLNELLSELEADLQALARDVASGRLDSFRKEAHAFLRQLRMELLRHHRRVTNRFVAPEQSDTTARLLGEQAELADRWGILVQARGARVGIDKWRPTEILDAVDQIAEDMPEFVEAPFEPSSFNYVQDETPLQSLRRFGLRVRRRWAGYADGTEPTRSVSIGVLVRYHLMGKLPARIEGVAALLVAAERQLIDRTRDLFDSVTKGYQSLADQFPEGGDDPTLRSKLVSLRQAFDDDLATAINEVNQMVEDGAIRMACVLGETHQTIKAEAAIISTLDLSTFSRRFSKVHAERDRARKRLADGFAQARQVNAAQYSLLSLEFEMGSLEGRIEDAVHTFSSELGRSFDGRAHLQLVRITRALDEAIAEYEQAFDLASTGEELTVAIRDHAKPLERVVSEAVRASVLLREQLTDESALAPLLDSVARSTRALTDRYRIPSSRPARGAWRLPAAVAVVEVPFRQLVQGHVETSVSPNLLQLLRELVVSVHPLATAIEELDRAISFNVEVAVSEVEEFETEKVPVETRALVREMIVGTFQRRRKRLGELEQSFAGWGTTAQSRARQAVVGGLDELRWQLVEGRVDALRSRLARSTDGRWWLEVFRTLPVTMARVRKEVSQLVRSALGGERIKRLRNHLGLPATRSDIPIESTSFSQSPGANHLPLVYRRLFSAQALEAGDLLIGRSEAIARGRRVLSGGGKRRLRTVALVGLDGVGKGAVTNAIVRGVDGLKPEAWTLSAPATAEQIDKWFANTRERKLITVGGLHWLVSARPGGIEPLRRFVAGVVADEGKNAWLIRSDLLVWRFMSSLSSLDDAFPEVVELEPFDIHQLESAVLARHAMSAHELSFGPPEPSGRMAHELGRRLLRVQARQAWFRDLHEASGGLIRDALLLWMAAVDRVDEERGQVWMGPVPSPPSDALQQLPEDDLLTLWQAARNGWTDPEIHATLFRCTSRQAEAHLTRLAHLGILVAHEGRYRIAVHLRGAVVRVMMERGWVQ